MTIGFHSPLPPAPTGVADYAAALLEELRARGDVRVNSAGGDVCLYHLGNNPLHREIYRQALVRPGVAVLHDAVLHHFLLGLLGRADYIEEFVYNYGEWSRGLAAELWEARSRSPASCRTSRTAMKPRRRHEESNASSACSPRTRGTSYSATGSSPIPVSSS